MIPVFINYSTKYLTVAFYRSPGQWVLQSLFIKLTVIFATLKCIDPLQSLVIQVSYLHIYLIAVLTIFSTHMTYLIKKTIWIQKTSLYNRQYIYITCAIRLLQIQKKTLICCAFDDFKKAFDYIWRVGLWSKMLKYSINGKVLNV